VDASHTTFKWRTATQILAVLLARRHARERDVKCLRKAFGSLFYENIRHLAARSPVAPRRYRRVTSSSIGLAEERLSLPSIRAGSHCRSRR